VPRVYGDAGEYAFTRFYFSDGNYYDVKGVDSFGVRYVHDMSVAKIPITPYSGYTVVAYHVSTTGAISPASFPGYCKAA
jgi:hypothetical protein